MDTLQQRVARALALELYLDEGIADEMWPQFLRDATIASAIVIEECANVAERFCDEVYGPGVVDAIRDLGASND